MKKFINLFLTVFLSMTLLISLLYNIRYEKKLNNITPKPIDVFTEGWNKGFQRGMTITGSDWKEKYTVDSIMFEIKIKQDGKSN